MIKEMKFKCILTFFVKRNCNDSFIIIFFSDAKYILYKYPQSVATIDSKRFKQKFRYNKMIANISAK